MKRWRWVLLLVPLLIGCGQPAIGLDLYICQEDPVPDAGLEPVIIIPFMGPLFMYISIPWPEHCEDFGLGIDDGMGPSPPGPNPDGGDAAGGGGGGGAD